jgi:AcrR family transcriptional regulator
MIIASDDLNARKSPVQARSRATREALHSAAIQVLTRGGLGKCTTTHIAKRAGTSVGTLYQYYPNRDALLAAVLQRSLARVADAIDDMCLRLRGSKLSEMAVGLVDVFLQIKLSQPEESKALFAVAAERGGAALVLNVHIRMASSISDMLASTCDGRFADPAIVSAVALSSIVGSVRSVLEGYAPPSFEDNISEQLVSLVSAYFASVVIRSDDGNRSVD